MTLIELLIACTLSAILVGVAAFIFTQSQQIFTRVGGRLDTAQSFRLAATMLEADAARMESPRNATISGGLVTGSVPWLSITGSSGSAPDLRTDQISFVTHASVSVLDAPNSTNPAITSDHLVYVTYKLDNISTGGTSNHGLVRQLNLVTLQSSGNGQIDNSLLPNNSPPPSTGVQTPLTMYIAPAATGLFFRYMDPTTLAFTAANGTSGAGSCFYKMVPNPLGPTPPTVCQSLPPSAIELNIYAPEKINNTNGLKLSVTRAIEVLAPR